MQLLTLYPLSPTLRLLLACALLGSSCLVIWRIATALGIVKTTKSRAKELSFPDIAPKSGISSNSVLTNRNPIPKSSPSTGTGTDRTKLGAAKIATIAVIASLIVIGTVSGFTGAKVESASNKPVGYTAALNQIVFRDHLYLPVVDTPVMSDYDWFVIDNDPKSVTYQKQTQVHFCATGLKPPFNEGDKVWIKFRVDVGCLTLLAYGHDVTGGG
jgi:hypothetical protein